MRIKKYKAKSLAEGKALIKSELGEDAVVLSSRTVHDSENGEGVELVAAIDDRPGKNRRTAKAPPKEPRPEVHSDARTFVKTAGDIFSEIEKIRTLLSGVSDSVKYKYAASLGDIPGRIFLALRKSGMEENLALRIAGKISGSADPGDLTEAIREGRRLATEHIRCVEPLQQADGRKIAVFTGTTGSGKTTTLVKLAIITRLVMQARVLVVSADTHKVGGAEQLETYASIANLPYRSAYSPEELDEIVRSEKNFDFIYIDTTGRSQQNKKHLQEISEYVRKSSADNVFLVQPAGASQSMLAEVIRKFGATGPTSMILTKLDETPGVGEAISALESQPIPLMYFTTGQQIPEDIEPASAEKLGELLLPDDIGFYSAEAK